MAAIRPLDQIQVLRKRLVEISKQTMCLVHNRSPIRKAAIAETKGVNRMVRTDRATTRWITKSRSTWSSRTFTDTAIMAVSFGFGVTTVSTPATAAKYTTARFEPAGTSGLNRGTATCHAITGRRCATCRAAYRRSEEGRHAGGEKDSQVS